ncbi:MAG: putative DNA binding domain-containing protein [Spirochaetales bacterium]|nr:putative DNA binding domain-containing protein [Spirochaetales bacterium]
MFDSIEELIKKIQLGEDSVLELKSVSIRGNKVSTPDRKDLADEFAAFGNSYNGVLVLGVDDKTKEIEGIPLENLDIVETFVREICNDSIDPPLNVRIVKMTLPDIQGIERPIIKVDIPRSLFVHKSPHGYFNRIGSSKREMKPEYLARLFQQRSQARLIRFEEQFVPGTGMGDLSHELISRFTSKSTEPEEVVLLKRNLLAKEEDNTIRASVAGILFCSKHPELFLPNTFIEAVRYRGIKQDSNYQIDALQIKGPLNEQIKQAMAFFKRNQTVAATKEPQRTEYPQFSEKAVFEAIVNAVAHRDYSISGSKIRFFMFDDRLEIYSPGALPNTVTIESIDLRQATRNELITSLLAECPVEDINGNVGRIYFMEKRGDGVPIIMNESEKISGMTPIYKLIDDSELLLTIYSKVKKKWK